MAAAALLLMMLGSAAAQDPAIAWEESVEKAAERAGREGKLVLVYFRTPKHPWCRRLESEVWTDVAVRAALAQSFVAVRLDRDAHPEHAARWQVGRVPHCVAATPELARVSRLIDYRDPPGIRAWLQTVTELFPRLREVLSRIPKASDDPVLRRDLGDLHVKLGNLPEAVAAFQDALARNAAKAEPTDADRRFTGETLVRLGDAYLIEPAFDKLPGVIEDLARLDPEGKLGFRDNVLYLKAMAELNPTEPADPPARRERAHAAHALLQEAAAKHADSDKNADVLLWLGALYVDLDADLAKAEEALATLLQRHPSAPAAAMGRPMLEEVRRRKRAQEGGGGSDPGE